MKRRALLQTLPVVALLPAVDWLASAQDRTGGTTMATTVYELRIYHALEGKLDDLLRRFRDHTTKLFEKHGNKKVGHAPPQGGATHGQDTSLHPCASQP